MTEHIVDAYMALPPKDRYLIARRLGVIDAADQAFPYTQAELDKRRLERVHQRRLVEKLAAEIATTP